MWALNMFCSTVRKKDGRREKREMVRKRVKMITETKNTGERYTKIKRNVETSCGRKM